MMRLRVTFATLALVGAGHAAGAQGARHLTLGDAVALAQSRGLQARSALDTRDAARARDRVFVSAYLPSLSIGGSAPSYTRSITPVVQPDGSTLYRPVEQVQGALTASIVQRVPWTNTTFTFSSALSQVQLTGTDFRKTWSATPVSIGINQPLFRANSQHWDLWQQELRYTSSERKYLESREDAAAAAASAFFDLHSAELTLRNATTNAATNDTLYTLNTGRFEVGKIGENDLLQSELALLRARASLDDAKLAYDRAKAQLCIVLNLPAGTDLTLEVTPDVPAFEADTLVAVAQAKLNTSGMSDAELAEVSADRAVSEARWNSGAGGTLSASYGYNASANNVPDAYKNLLDARQLNVGVSIPVWQWGSHSAQVQAARSDRDAARNTATLARENVENNAKFAALSLSQARRSLTIAAKADTVAQKRFEVAYNRYVIGRINVDNLYIAQGEKDQALASYIQALRGFWFAYYQLRKLTLYDFEAGRPIR
ncbi:MAG TPA: TolC family protein [Gemmatimonadaceae bacterium]|nr:TolC family protein [Gemmatimonadaceae bacterium]